MTRPYEVDGQRLAQMLAGRKGVVIRPKGITHYKDPVSKKTILSVHHPLTNTERRDAWAELVDRLSGYYRERVGVPVERRLVHTLLTGGTTPQ